MPENEIVRKILDILFPKFCIGCNKEGRYLCTDCTLFMSEANFICPACKEAAFFGRRHKRCSHKKGLDGLISLWDYEGLVKKLILETKQSQLIDIPQEMVEYGIYSMKENEERFSEFLSFLLDKETALSYIPAKKKGFNHAKEIAKNLSNAFKKEIISPCKEEKRKQVVLVDDVWISGETMESHAKTFKGSRVWGFTLARVP